MDTQRDMRSKHSQIGYHVKRHPEDHFQVRKKAIRNSKPGAGEMSQQLRAFIALSEDPSSIPRTHKAAHNCL